MENKIQKLLREKDEVGAYANEIEIHTLVKWGYIREILDNDNILEYRRLKAELDPFDEEDVKVRIEWEEYIANKIRKEEEKLSEEEKDITEVIQEIWDELNDENVITKGDIGRMIKMGFTKYEILSDKFLSKY